MNIMLYWVEKDHCKLFFTLMYNSFAKPFILRITTTCYYYSSMYHSSMYRKKMKATI